MRPDVKINDLSLFTLGWLRESVDFPTPQSQTNTIVVPGRNAPIRYTEALGSISYQPREFTILLSMLGSRTQFDSKVAEVVNRFAGRLCKVICSDTPQVYAIGTLEAEPAYDPLTGKFRYAAGYRINENQCRNQEAAYVRRRIPVFPGHHRGPGSTKV